MGKLILLRHGQSTWNLENRFTGWIDIPLSEQGEKEAEEAGRALRDIKIDEAFTSDLIRAKQTLEIALRAAGQENVPTREDPAIRERMYGDLQGKNKQETIDEFGEEQVKLWRRSYDIAPPNGESLKDTAARALPYFNDVILPEVKAGKNVLVSAHGNSLRAIVMIELNIPNGVPIIYEIDSEGLVLSRSV